MFVQDNKQPSAKTAPGPKPAKKLYSIFALQRDKMFTGEFETATAKHKFTFAPKSAQLLNNKLQLIGTFRIGARKIENVTATLASTQGGLGALPSHMAARPIDSTPGLPPTEATGSRGFVGTMYFQLSALNARALGLKVDMSKVQLNGRLFPLNEVERELQVLFSEIVAAVYQKEANAKAAASHIEALNRLLNAA
jgi:hypothetical protein